MAAPHGWVWRRHSGRYTHPNRTFIARRARAGSVPRCWLRASRRQACRKTRSWLFTTLSERTRCCCPVSVHSIAVIGALGSHPVPLMHHAALHEDTSTRRACAATDQMRVRRCSCTGALLQLRVRLCCHIHARRTVIGRRVAFCVVVCVCPCLRSRVPASSGPTFKALCTPTMGLLMAPNTCTGRPETQCALATA